MPSAKDDATPGPLKAHRPEAASPSSGAATAAEAVTTVPAPAATAVREVIDVDDEESIVSACAIVATVAAATGPALKSQQLPSATSQPTTQSFVTSTENVVLPTSKRAPATAINHLFTAAKDKKTAAAEAERAAGEAAVRQLASSGIRLVSTKELKVSDSVFVGHCAGRVRGMADVERCVLAVRHVIRSGAAHCCIYAYVLPSGDAGCDDDGEQYGGKKILGVLRDRVGLGRGGSGWFVAVSRWFGGTLLGPARFTHIAGCAHDALTEHQSTVS